MATLTIQTISESGINNVSYASAAGGGDVVDNNGNVFLHIKNGSGGELTVTITAQVTSVDNGLYGELTKANASIAIAGSGEAFIGPFTPAAYNNSHAQIAITYSGVTSLTIAALQLG